MAIGSAESPGSYGTQRRTLENGGRDERSSREEEVEEVEEEKEEGTGREVAEEEEEEEDEQEGPLSIVRGRSLVTRDSCDPDDP